MYWDVVEIEPISARELSVRFADGLAGVIQIDISFCNGVFEILRNDAVVQQAQVDDGVIVWPNGLDLAPDTMYNEIKRNPNRYYKIQRT